MKQRNQKHIALLSVVLVPALLLSACGSGASGQLSSSSTAPGSFLSPIRNRSPP